MEISSGSPCKHSCNWRKERTKSPGWMGQQSQRPKRTRRLLRSAVPEYDRTVGKDQYVLLTPSNIIFLLLSGWLETAISWKHRRLPAVLTRSSSGNRSSFLSWPFLKLDHSRSQRKSSHWLFEDLPDLWSYTQADVMYRANSAPLGLVSSSRFASVCKFVLNHIGLCWNATVF